MRTLGTLLHPWIIPICLCALALALIGARAWSDTTLVRELAKNKPKVLLICSGPQATEIARYVQGEILRNPDNNHKPNDIPILTADDANRMADNDNNFKDQSRIFFWIRDEQHAPVPTGLSTMLPIQSGDEQEGTCIIRCEIARKASKGLAFAILLVAQDQSNMKKIADSLLTRSAYRYELLPFESTINTVSVALFSDPKDELLAEQWCNAYQRSLNNGSPIYFSPSWYPLSDRDKLPPAKLQNCNEAYFIDCSKQNGALPSVVSTMLKDQSINNTSTVIMRQQKDQPNTSRILFYAPNDLILTSKVNGCSANPIPDGVTISNVIDLRKIGDTTLRVYGPILSDDVKEAIRSQIAQAMRQKLHMPVEERGDIFKVLDKEVTFEEMEGANNVRNDVRRKTGLRYIWLYQLLSATGSTQYVSNSTLLTTQNPPTYEQMFFNTDPEPAKPSLAPFSGRGKQEEYQRELDQWKPVHDAWLYRKQNWEEREYAHFETQWRRTVTKIVSVKVHGILRLIDLQDKNNAINVIWEKDCLGIAHNDTPNYLSDTVSVRGVGNRPSSIDTPPSTDDCPIDLQQQAAINGALDALSKLQGEAWLPSKTPAPTNSIAKQPSSSNSDSEVNTKPLQQSPNSSDNLASTPSQTIHPNTPTVSAISHLTVTITYPQGIDVNPGDIAYVIGEREIKDSSSGKVLETHEIALIKLRVMQVDSGEMQCVPVNPTEGKNLSLIRKGMTVKIVHKAKVGSKND